LIVLLVTIISDEIESRYEQMSDTELTAHKTAVIQSFDKAIAAENQIPSDHPHRNQIMKIVVLAKSNRDKYQQLINNPPPREQMIQKILDHENELKNQLQVIANEMQSSSG